MKVDGWMFQDQDNFDSSHDDESRHFKETSGIFTNEDFGNIQGFWNEYTAIHGPTRPLHSQADAWQTFHNDVYVYICPDNRILRSTPQQQCLKQMLTRLYHVQMSIS